MSQREIKTGDVKDVAHRLSRAAHFAETAVKAAVSHSKAQTDSDRTEHMAILTHAAERASVHAQAVAKLMPGSNESDEASLHAHRAQQHLIAVNRKSEQETERNKKKND